MFATSSTRPSSRPSSGSPSAGSRSLNDLVADHGYFLPSAGASDVAYALFTFPSLAAYEEHRQQFGRDPDFNAADRIRDESGCVLRYERSFLGYLGKVTCDGSRKVGMFWRDALGWPLVWDQNEQTAVQSPLGGTKISWDLCLSTTADRRWTNRMTGGA
jgi:NIPSNAP